MIVKDFLQRMSNYIFLISTTSAPAFKFSLAFMVRLCLHLVELSSSGGRPTKKNGVLL